MLQPGDPGYNANVQHGFIAAPSDFSTSGLQWRYHSYTITGATGTALGTGSTNTSTIFASQGDVIQDDEEYAAHACLILNTGGYDDWFLPSKDELYKLYLNNSVVSGLEYGSMDYYWSSTERDITYAYYLSFHTGAGYTYSSKADKAYVRPIRSF